LSLIIIVMLAGCSAPAGGKKGTGTIAGTVVDAGHNGVRGAAVRVVSLEERAQAVASGTTDARGDFVIDDVPPGKGLVIGVSKQLGQRVVQGRREGVEVRAGRRTDVGEIQLKMTPAR
jgi:hypothetical protein